MRKFVGFYENGTFKVGCSGASVYVYDQNNSELARFRDIDYAYYGAFQPGTNRFVVKSVGGKMAVYDLDRLELVKKFTVSRRSSQDSGFAFTPDGEYFYNLEMMDGTISHRLAVYRSSDFELCTSCFDDVPDLLLGEVEFSEDGEACYLLGYHRYEKDAHKFIGRFVNGEIRDERRLDSVHGDWLWSYMAYRRSGFTEQSYKAHQIVLLDDVHETSLAEEYRKLQ